MNQIIDITTYLPEESRRIRPQTHTKRRTGADFLMVLEAIVTGVIGVSMMVGIGAFLLMF